MSPAICALLPYDGKVWELIELAYEVDSSGLWAAEPSVKGVMSSVVFLTLKQSISSSVPRTTLLQLAALFSDVPVSELIVPITLHKM